MYQAKFSGSWSPPLPHAAPCAPRPAPRMPRRQRRPPPRRRPPPTRPPPTPANLKEQISASLIDLGALQKAAQEQLNRTQVRMSLDDVVQLALKQNPGNHHRRHGTGQGRRERVHRQRRV